MAKTIAFHWDFGSTNSYFALHLIKPIAARHGATVVPHPFNLGYVFRHHNYVLMDEPKAKIANRIVDLHRWARRHKLPFRMPSRFPIKTAPALRGALAMRRFGKEWEYLEAIFAAYWERDDASVAELAGLRPVATTLGVDPDRFLALTESAEVRQELIAETDAALARGVFGAPTFVVGDEIFWG
jgi:2-hydroxychromene-2-carboxylate isomerase